ncbi:MAG TPA: nuclear transport factor 2 family protein [Planctomycetota bacterium]|nr:nuclear transport factor 2 family protein [Planctomycetota bacterium]
MRKLIPLALLLASCMPIVPSQPNPGPEIVAAMEVMYDDLSARRWEALEAHFLPDAALVFATPSGPKRMAPPKFIEMVRKNVEGKEVFEERMEAASVRAHGDVAQVWSSFAGREGNGQDIRTWSGVDAFTLVKVDGKWKIALIAVSQDPAEDKK